MLMRFPLIATRNKTPKGRAKGTRKMTCKSVAAIWRVAAAIVAIPLPLQLHDRRCVELHVDVALIS